MHLLLGYVYFHHFFATSAVIILATVTDTMSDFALFHPESERSTIATTRKNYGVDEKDIKRFLKKMLGTVPIASITSITTPLNTENETISVGGRNALNIPKLYAGTNANISELCPYFEAFGVFKMDKMAADYWPRFYNMNETLQCFMISVVKLTEGEMKQNDLIFGSFGGKINWKQCHFEIKPQRQGKNTRHFLLGDDNDTGVMRNILITTSDKGEITMEEESPDQWLMVKNLVLLRDCVTGDVVVFTTFPLTTTKVDIMGALLELGEIISGRVTYCGRNDAETQEVL